MREAAERRQHLELEHEQALAVLHAKQQEIDLLQKAQVEAKKEHEGALRLLESKVRELEEKCRTQSEQFRLLSQDLERLREHAGKIDLLGGGAGASLDVPASGKPFPQFMNGLAPSIGKAQESAVRSRTVVGDYIRPLPLAGDRLEPPSVKPAFLSRSASPRCRFESDMDNERNSNTSKQRYSGKVHLCVARYSYNPFDGPNENPEAELPLTAGKYLYIYGDMDEDGFYEGELLDGQRGLVPSNFVDFVQDSESRLASTLGNEQDQNLINHAGIGLEGENILDLHAPTHIDAGITDTGEGTLGVNIDEVGEDVVPYPRKITLIKQLARSVIVAWEPPAVPPGWGTVSSYNVLVDQETRVSLMLGSRTKALIEKLNTAACTYRISVQCITSRGSSDELQCTLLVGKDVVVAPSHLRVDNITQISAQLSWLPTNSNYSHVIFLNEEELDVVRAARYKYQFFNLRPNMAYKVKVLAKPHQMPWQLPLEQREKKEAFVEFSTLPAGPPAPPQDVTVHAGATPATVQVSWKPPALTTAGLSNGANVSGYGVYAKGQRTTLPTIAHVSKSRNHLALCLCPHMLPDEYSERDRLSPDFYEESETDPGAEELPARIFVALFDYDPLTMSPNPDAAEEELPFKEGQIIKVYGDKDADGFYRGETCARLGLIPCNMVSEIQADDEEMMDQLLRQGFLPLNTPVEKIERSRRSSRHPGATRRVVALYDYDPRESSPNIDVEAELTFCTGDIITVFGEIDEDGFYYGELNGQKGLVPSNFLEEVPDDVEVYLSDAPGHYPRDAPTRSKAKRVSRRPQHL
ncbi:RIMS-binding protein 2 [Leptonychotes weddellii]|uniref:RIMS-binding protein 2 n=1 Tax=Leptonychotes weddellii TaxID=9713 RepID=A0A7F8REX9_LEPWE|nr:RIMS-binding protein 2 [Leptonychotes weddellii]